ncbi:MAG: hypothetical protein OEY59_07020 [Deltaproteobacteria bacterium]|nr:hypothetical protein [Deltaproteobacteria bacterium]
MYKATLNKSIFGPNGESIPDDPRNAARQRYEAWLLEGNQPDPAETLDEKKARLFGEFDQKRQRMLQVTDYMDGRTYIFDPDPVIDAAKINEFGIWRQALRDLGNSLKTSGLKVADLETPAWPVVPDSVLPLLQSKRIL